MIRACLPRATYFPAYAGYFFANYHARLARTVVAYRLYLTLNRTCRWANASPLPRVRRPSTAERTFLVI